MTTTFDATAQTFTRYRDFPAGVPEAIRATIRKYSSKTGQARVLDIGAGTGRVGKAYVQAGDLYVGADFSFPMLREFAMQSPSACLIQADGEQLPFPARAFDLVLLIQVLSGSERWQQLLQEALRVVAANGMVVIGHTVAPQSGLDALLKQRLITILEEMSVSVYEPQKSRKSALAWLKARAADHRHAVAASWAAERNPKQFIARHRTGARFAALPPATQETALQRLSSWTETNLGSLDKNFTEEHSFELDIFRIE